MLKEKYKGYVYSFYQAVCDKYKLVPEPPIPPEFDCDSDGEGKAEEAPPQQSSSSSGGVDVLPSPPAHGCHGIGKHKEQLHTKVSEDKQTDETGTPRKKKRRGAKKRKLTGDQRRQRQWQALDDALENNSEDT